MLNWFDYIIDINYIQDMNTLRTIKDNYTLSSIETFNAVSRLYPNVFKSWELTPLWLGTQGIILLDKRKQDLVLKLWLDPDKAKALALEYDKHMEFYLRFEELKNKGLIYDHLHVVEPLHFFAWRDECFMTMARIRGQSLKTKEIIARYFSELTWRDRIRMNLLSDFEVERLATEELGLEQSMVDLLAIEALDSARKFYPRFMVDRLQESIDIMKSNWLMHTDFHSGNLMVDSNLHFHIIDLWSVSIKPNTETIKNLVGNILS